MSSNLRTVLAGPRRFSFRKHPVTPGPSHRATGIAPVAETGAGRAACKIADLRRHARPECSSAGSDGAAERGDRRSPPVLAHGLARCRLKPGGACRNWVNLGAPPRLLPVPKRGRLIAGVSDACLGRDARSSLVGPKRGSTLPHLTSPSATARRGARAGASSAPAGALDARARVTVARGLRSRQPHDRAEFEVRRAFRSAQRYRVVSASIATVSATISAVSSSASISTPQDSRKRNPVPNLSHRA